MCLTYQYDMFMCVWVYTVTIKNHHTVCVHVLMDWNDIRLGIPWWTSFSVFYFLLFSLFLSTFMTLITCLHEQCSGDQPCICPFWLYVEHSSRICSRTWGSHSAYYRHLLSWLLPDYSLEWVHWGVFYPQRTRVLIPPSSHHHVLD